MFRICLDDNYINGKKILLEKNNYLLRR